MVIVINYADYKYRKAQILNTKTAYKYGKADKVIEYSPKDIDDAFYSRYKMILDCNRGGGYWLWKPYIIKKALDDAKDGDYIFYADSGSYFINDIRYLVKQMEKDNESIMSFSLPLEEIRYTKRDVIEYFGMWNVKNELGNQRLATFILIKRGDISKKFVDDYLMCATHGLLITDKPSEIQPEDEMFIENRHDQSIFSMLCKKYGVPDYRDPSEYGIHPILYHLNDDWNEKYIVTKESDYPQIMVSHRKKNPVFVVRLDAWLRRRIPISVYLRLLPIRDCIVNLIRSINKILKRK